MTGILKKCRTGLKAVRWSPHRGFTVLLFTGMLLAGRPGSAQNFTEIDRNTYQLYLEKKWDELILAGKSAIKKDIDYYYLRLRIGIAFYEKKNYKSAQLHFRKALDFNSGDPLAMEYLYYACLFGGQSQQAALLYKKMPESIREKVMAPGLKIIDRVSVEYLYNQTFTDNLLKDPTIFNGLPAGVQIVTRSFQNLNVSMQHFMHPGTSFIQAYTYLVKNSLYYYDDGLNRFETEGQQVRQQQYYLSPSFTFDGGLVISPSFHYLHVAYQVPVLTGSGPGPGGGNEVVFREEYEGQMAGGLSLVKFHGPFSFRLGAVYSNLNRTQQLTGSAGLTWYPMGNLDLYLSAGLNVHNGDLAARGDSVGSAGETGSGFAGTVLIPDLLLGWSIASKLWIEVSGTYGQMKNFTERNGYLVYNGLDWVKYKAVANLVLPLTAKGSVFYAGARFAGYENRFIPLDTTQPANINSLTYNSISIFGGISWKF